ncbi:MAG TPA: HAD family hydrolase [Prolixibacteraceae bacterium]|nr:HAD family hydrolase [Prolixibacteraceae bacterium]
MSIDENKILLILDLDETLIHSFEEKPEEGFDFRIFHYFVVKRPYLDQFLDECSRDFRLAVWSSSSDDYAERMVEKIFPPGIKPAFVWGRSKATFRPVNGSDDFSCQGFSHYDFVKRLRKIKPLGYSLERTLMVDDTPHKLIENYGNAIYIKEFNGEKDDEELLFLLNYLQTIKECPNVLKLEKRNWRKRNLM